ncbi:MAG: murein biosynthesis integral membrane protein MurJ [Planctomycetaceae bacterium]|nr:murein biosynthesis integral membrane protein MurJ [Planctomycetaceae bacterium]
MNEQQQEHHREREHFFGAAKIVAALTSLSRVSGLFRDMAITALGATRAASAFRVAFMVPNLFRRLFGEGALSAAFVPVFSDVAEKGGLEKARLLLSNFIALAAVVLCGAAVVVSAGLLVWAWASPKPDLQLLLTMTVIMLPFMVTVCLLAMGSAALNCRGHFVYPAVAPILLNLFQIAAAVAGLKLIASVPSSLLLVSASVPVAGLVQLIGVFWLLKRSNLAIVLRLRPIEPGIATVLRLMAPALIGLGFLQFCELLQMVIGWVMEAKSTSPYLEMFGWQILKKPLWEGDVVRIDTARRLYQLPMGVLAMSLATTIFPLLSRYALRNDLPALRESVNRAIRLSFLEGFAAGAGLFVLAEPIMVFLFQRGNFTHDDALRAAAILKWYSLGIWANCMYPILTRAFYALKDPRTPLRIAVVLTVFSVASLLAMLIWIPQLGPRSFGLSISLTTVLTTVLLAAALRRRIGSFGDRQMALSILKSVVATAAMVAAIYGLLWALAAGGLYRPWLATIAGVTVGLGVLYLATKVLRMPELDEMLGRLRKK